MKNTFGSSVAVTLFGESHGEMTGAVLDGMAPGIAVDESFIASQLALRRSYGKTGTARREKDEFRIVSGVKNGFTTGTPVCVLIPNTDVKRSDYDAIKDLARPGHADFAARCKYHGFEDRSGGGHFSGRLTAPLVAAGAIAISALRGKGIYIGTHIKSCAGTADRDFEDLRADIEFLGEKAFAVLDGEAEMEMLLKIEQAAERGDSVGGVLETAVAGVPAGIGEPWFDTAEGVLSHALFSVPAVKGVQFGAGFDFACGTGSALNDEFYSENGRVFTKTNNNGGVNGGITNGMPVLFRCAVKPTPSISLEQGTVNMATGENTKIIITGRHDPAIVHRARVVIDSVTALVFCDLLAQRYGTDWIGER